MSCIAPASDLQYFKFMCEYELTANLFSLYIQSVNLHGLANTSIFHNNLRVMLSPLKSPVLRKYSNPFKRPGMYPSISKCNAKR